MGSEPTAQSSTKRGTDRARTEALRLLFVEDDDDFQQVLRVLLSRVNTSRPVETLFLSTITDAQRVVEATRVDAIVSDFHLPDGNGVEFLDHARRKAPHSRRVILTGHPEVARRTERFEGSVQRLWDKGLNPKELQTRIERLVHEIVPAPRA